MSEPTVSVLVPVYNRENLLGPCVRSALSATSTDLEVVVVDNASTDGTWEVCQTLAREDARVRCFRNETNVGPVRNWRRCLEEATGKFGKILFSDDLLFPGYFERTLPLMADPEIGFVFTAVEVGLEPGTGATLNRWLEGISPSGAYIRTALFEGQVPLSPGAAIFRLDDLRRNLVDGIPSPSYDDFFNHGAGPDLLIYLLTANQYPKVAHVPEPLTFFREHGNSITVASQAQFLSDRYMQARFWFSYKFMGPRITRELLIQTWYQEWRQGRRTTPGEVARRFLTEPVGIDIASAFWLAKKVLRNRLGLARPVG